MSVVSREVHRRKLSGIVQTALLAGLMLIPFFMLGRTLFGTVGFIALGIAVAFLSANAGRRSVQPVLQGATPLRYYEAPQLHEIVGDISTRAGLSSVPMLYLIQSSVPNAVTIGRRDEPVIVVTYGLLNSLSPREIAGVLAHEIAHIRNNDLQVFVFAEIMKQLTVVFSRFIWFLIVLQLPFALMTGQTFALDLILSIVAAPLVVLVIQLALLRTREFAADVGAVELTGDAEGLATALYRVSNPVRNVFGVLLPVPQRQESSLFRTHPATEKRIQRLLELQ